MPTQEQSYVETICNVPLKGGKSIAVKGNKPLYQLEQKFLGKRVPWYQARELAEDAEITVPKDGLDLLKAVLGYPKELSKKKMGDAYSEDKVNTRIRLSIPGYLNFARLAREKLTIKQEQPKEENSSLPVEEKRPSKKEVEQDIHRRWIDVKPKKSRGAVKLPHAYL